MPQYYIFHKPYRVLPKNIYPVGRLDYDSEGLLLLTDDKPLTHQLLDPKFAHPRTYWVQVEGIITAVAIKQLEEGVNISVDGKQHRTQKAKASIFADEPGVSERNPPVRFRKEIPTSWLSLTLTEGKNRQVRRMTAAVGFPTLRLIRYSIGNLTLDGIKPGEYKQVGSDVKELLIKK